MKPSAPPASATRPPWHKVARLVRDLSRPELTNGERALRFAQRAVDAAGLRPHVMVGRRIIFELTTPPGLFRGLRDLSVRRGGPADLEPLATIDDTDRALIRRRFARGDLAYVAESRGRVLGHTWFHPGPTPFEEDRLGCIAWALDASTWWSFNGAAAVDARASGVFVKLFQTALREVLELHGASRIQGYIYDTNKSSIVMHERLGFVRVGAMLSVCLPGVKWLHFSGTGGTRQWIVRRSSQLALPMPPV